jgi:site-specific DNA-methyltransferase (adenine-specific)
MDLMREYPDKYFDLAIVDLEYNIGASKPSIKPCIAIQKNGSSLRIKQPNYQPKEWDFKLSSPEYLNELFRVSKNQIIWGGNYYGLSGGYIVWDKLNGESDQFDCELAFCSFNKRTDIVYFLWAGMFQGIYCGKDIRKALIQQGNKQLNEERIHPTQKPVALYKWLLKNYAKEGDKILDTHGGSMSSVIACIDMGFDITCCELDKDYFEAGLKRVNQFKSQTNLFR